MENKERLMIGGKLDEIIFARFLPGEDILLGLYDICVRKNIRTGIILDGSGAGVDFTYQHFPINPKFVPTNVTIGTMDGKCEMSLQGTIGTTISKLPKEINPDDVVDKMFPNIPGYLETPEDKWHMIGSMGGPGTPYIHAHCVATNKDTTVCGHLMPGTKVGSGDMKKPSHFTVVIAKVSGVELQATIDQETGFYQNLVEVI